MARKYIFIFMIIVSAACTKTQVKDSLKKTPYLNQPSTAVVLSTNVKDKSFAKCVETELENHTSILKLIAEEKFRDALFPWFEPGTYPQSINELGSIMNSHLVQDRIRSLGIRFVIFVRGHKLKGKFEGPFFVGGGGGYPFGGVVGYTSSERKTEISAAIWDIQEMASLGDLQVEKSGSFKLIGIGIPIPIPEITKSEACIETAKGISNFLAGKWSHTGDSND